MKLNDEQLREILLAGNYVVEEDLKGFDPSRGVGLKQYVYQQNLLNKDLLGQAIAEHLKVPYADLNSFIPSKEQVLKISRQDANKYRIVLYKETDDEIIIASDAIEQAKKFETGGKLFRGKKVTFAYSLSEDINNVLKFYTDSLIKKFESTIELHENFAPYMLNDLLEDAFDSGTSDIHMEYQGEEVRIRYRVDGVLKDVGIVPPEIYQNLLNRIKILAKMRIDLHAQIQEGAIRFEHESYSIDVRVSIIPTVNGEKTVMRLLSRYVGGLALKDLGINDSNQDILKTNIQKPYGMILVTGPTGSGKTTTLYALLRMINEPEINITTIEDPVEYRIENINQIQVDRDLDITFAKGLRSIVRQDPDVILVGEIRDEETAEIAVNATLTGHLLLSTFHANNSPTAITRLVDMGIEPFLLASTLEIVVSQRLIRKICRNCRVSFKAKLSDLKNYIYQPEKYFSEKEVTLYYGKGCHVCGHTGYDGRSALFEVIEMTKEMRELIHKSPTSDQIWELAVKQGSLSLFADGIDKVKNGITTIEELMRVAVQV